ncbi:MAG: hypothetical protein JRN22_00445 [Nitrososphaerota archaeon]|nr:hypothetical protein [Nitrososphaerota archaeon]
MKDTQVSPDVHKALQSLHDSVCAIYPACCEECTVNSSSTMQPVRGSASPEGISPAADHLTKALTEVVGPVEERIARLEAEAETQSFRVTVESSVKAAVEEVIKPVRDRIRRLEDSPYNRETPGYYPDVKTSASPSLDELIKESDNNPIVQAWLREKSAVQSMKDVLGKGRRVLRN